MILKIWPTLLWASSRYLANSLDGSLTFFEFNHSINSSRLKRTDAPIFKCGISFLKTKFHFASQGQALKQRPMRYHQLPDESYEKSWFQGIHLRRNPGCQSLLLIDIDCARLPIPDEWSYVFAA